MFQRREILLLEIETEKIAILSGLPKELSSSVFPKPIFSKSILPTFHNILPVSYQSSFCKCMAKPCDDRKWMNYTFTRLIINIWRVKDSRFKRYVPKIARNEIWKQKFGNLISYLLERYMLSIGKVQSEDNDIAKEYKKEE